MMLWTYFGVMLLVVGKMIAVSLPAFGLAFGESSEEDDRAQYQYITPLDLGTEPY